MDVGQNCHKSGLAAYTSAQGREKTAKKASSKAAKECTKAKNARVQVGAKALSAFKVGCSAFLNDPKYTAAKSHLTKTCNKATKKKAAYEDAVKATKTAKKAHEKTKNDCACRAQKTHKSAVKSAKGFNSAANAKAWSKAHHMMCVLDGKAANKCKVPKTPKVTTPSMPSWVAKAKCGAKVEFKTMAALDTRAGCPAHAGSHTTLMKAVV